MAEACWHPHRAHTRSGTQIPLSEPPVRNVTGGWLHVCAHCRWVARAVNYADLPSSSMPTAIVLPCNLFVADLRAGALTDFDLRHSVVGSALDSEGSASADPSAVAPILLLDVARPGTARVWVWASACPHVCVLWCAGMCLCVSSGRCIWTLMTQF